MTHPMTPEQIAEGRLKACPFCGGEAATSHIRDGRVARCRGCGATARMCFHGPADKPDADARAIAAWNTRAEDPAYLDLCEQQHNMPMLRADR